MDSYDHFASLFFVSLLHVKLSSPLTFLRNRTDKLIIKRAGYLLPVMHMYYKLEIPGLQLKLHNSKINFQFAEFFISLILQAHLRSNFLYWS